MIKFLMHEKSLEIRRQIFHLFFGLFISLLISLDLFYIRFFVVLLFISIIVSIILKKRRLPIISKILDYFDRPKDLKYFPGKGYITFLIGVIISYIIFAIILHNKIAALISIISLTIADSFSSLYGNMFGKLKNPLNKKKSIEGPIFAMFFLFITMLLFLPARYAILLSFLCVFFETLEIKIMGKVMDDNIYIPLIAGTLIILLNTL